MNAIYYVRRFGIRKTLRRLIVRFRSSPYIDAVAGKHGLEIGGPSETFVSAVPIYPHIGSLDNAVYSAATVWADNSKEYRFHTDKPAGRNFILDGTNLYGIPDASYDFVLSCHSLEHIANPIKALKEWQRITKRGGHLLLVLPHYRWTFDHRRPLTSIAHMLEDYKCQIGEDDDTHLQESLELHDLKWDEHAKTPEEVRQKFLNFSQNRCLHHHTFDLMNGAELVEVSGYEVLDVQLVEPFHIVILAQLTIK